VEKRKNETTDKHRCTQMKERRKEERRKEGRNLAVTGD
jgi:hypothetical protein